MLTHGMASTLLTHTKPRSDILCKTKQVACHGLDIVFSAEKPPFSVFDYKRNIAMPGADHGFSRSLCLN
jgi:hypothetical protein